MNFEIYINDNPVSIYGSQGQKRTTIISLKLAEANVIYDEISIIEFYSSNDVIKELNNNFYGMILQSEIKKVERLREYKDEWM